MDGICCKGVKGFAHDQMISDSRSTGHHTASHLVLMLQCIPSHALSCVGGMGMGMSGEGMAYGYRPGPEYAWAPMHPANPPSESLR